MGCKSRQRRIRVAESGEADGQASKLSDEQKEKIKGVIKEDPSGYGYTNWDGPSLSDFISKEFDVEYSIRACQKLFHELGFSLIRPQTYPSLNEPDEDAREAFKERVAEVFSDPCARVPSMGRI